MTGTMTKPSAVFPLSPASTPPQFPSNTPDPSIYTQGFDQLLNNRGIHFTHYRAVPCPNMKSMDDNNHHPLCPHCDGSGILYYRPKTIVGVLVSNSVEKQFEYNGVWEAGTCVITFPAEYADGEQADFSLYDKLVVEDYTVRLWEKKQYEPRPGGLQQLRYPIANIENLITADDTVVTEFKEGEDFNIVNGLIEWVPGKEPGYDDLTGIGDVFAVSYFAKPIYVVLQPMRELRVTQQMMSDGTKIARRLPQQVVAKRDYFVNPAEKLA
jgi:hypothetical protein